MADGSIIIDTRIDTGGVSKGLNAVKAGMTRISAQVSKMGDSAKSSFQRQITAITDLYQNYEKQERKVSELKSKLEEALLRKIVREETAGRQTGGGSYRFTAQINRRTLFDEMMKEAQMRRDTSGRNPFEMA